MSDERKELRQRPARKVRRERGAKSWNVFARRAEARHVRGTWGDARARGKMDTQVFRPTRCELPWRGSAAREIHQMRNKLAPIGLLGVTTTPTCRITPD